jgi:hypothetical protein
MGGWVCCLQLLLVLASAVILRSASSGIHDHVLLSRIQESPNLEGQVPIFISPRNRVAQLYPQELGSLLLYESQSQSFYSASTLPSCNSPAWTPTENTIFYCQECVFTGPLPSNGSLIVERLCLLTHCLARGIHVTVIIIIFNYNTHYYTQKSVITDICNLISLSELIVQWKPNP